MSSGGKRALLLLRPCLWGVVALLLAAQVVCAGGEFPQYPADSPLSYAEWKRGLVTSRSRLRYGPGNAFLRNAYMVLGVSGYYEYGMLGMRTVLGDPEDSSDDDKILIYASNSYNESSSWVGTSGLAVRIDGYDYQLDGTTPISGPTVGRESITLSWLVDDVLIEAEYELLDVGTGIADTGKISFSFTDQSGRASRTIGLKIGFDMMVGDNDAARIATSAGIITRETGFGQTGAYDGNGEPIYYDDAIPDFWQAFEENNIASPGLVAQGTFVGGGATPPDKFVAGSWSSVSSSYNFDYTPSGYTYYDSAVGMWWLNRELGARQTTTFFTYFGLGDVTGVAGDLALSVSAPSALSEVDNAFDPNPFTINAQVQNNTGSSLTNVGVTLDLPSGLSVVSRESNTKIISQLSNGSTDLVSWQVYADSAYNGQTLSYTVQASGGDYTSEIVTRTITLPELAIVTEMTVEYPNGGEEFEEGTTQTIRWQGDAEVAHVDLAYSDDSGQTWSTIATGVANSGSYDWEVPSPTAGSSSRSARGSTSAVTGSVSDAHTRTNVFADGFEGGGTDWTVTSVSGVASWEVVDHPENTRVETPTISSDLVGLPDQGYLPEARSGTKCAWFGSSSSSSGTYMGAYDAGIQQLQNGGRSTAVQKGNLDTATVDLSSSERNGTTGYWLKFWTWWEIEAGDVGPGRYDQMRVLASSDGGTTFSVVGMLNPLTDLNFEPSHAYSSGGLGKVGEWVPVCFDLSSFLGEQVIVRFQFDTVDRYANGFRGWLIDDVTVSDEGPTLSLSGVTPSVGVAGDVLAATGSGLVYGATVTVGGVEATSVVFSAERVQFSIPSSLAEGDYDVTVENPDGSAVTLEQSVTVSSDTPPEVQSIAPDSGANTIATSVTITGTGFTDGASAYIAGEELTTVAFQSSTTLTATVPTGLSSGFQNVTVVNPDGLRGTLVGGFEVTGPPYFVRVSDSANSSVSDQSDEGFTIVEQSCPVPATPSDPSPADEALSVRLGTSLSWFGSRDGARATSCDFDDLTPGNTITTCGEVTFEISGLTSVPVVFTAGSAVSGVTSSASNVAGLTTAGGVIGGVFSPGTDDEFNYVSMYFGNDSGFTGQAVLTAYRDESGTVPAKSVSVTANGDDYCNQRIELYTPIGGKSWALSFSGSLLSPCIDDLSIGAGLCPTRFDVYFGTTEPLPLAASELTSAAWEPSRLEAGATYYWQVVSTNCCGESAGSVWSFTASQDLVVVGDIDTSQFPIIAAEVTVDTVSGDACGLSASNFALTDDGAAQSLTSVTCAQARSATYTVTYTSSNTSEDGSQRLLCVVVTDPNEGALDACGYYTAPCPLPSQPSSPSPSSGATGVLADVALSWDGGTSSSSCPTRWDVYFYTDPQNPPQTATVTDLSTATWDPSGLLDDLATYYWKVVAKNSRGEAESAEWSFATGGRSLTVLYPNGGEEFVEGTTETLTWTWDGAVDTVGLEYYDGSEWHTITENVANTGSYEWLVPAPASSSRSASDSTGSIVDADVYESEVAAQTRRPHHASVGRESYEWHVTEDDDLDIQRCFDYKWLHVPIATDAVPPAETTFTLVVSAWDVDIDDTTQPDGPERDRVYVNDYYVGELTGANRTWSVTTFDVPYDVLVFPGENMIDIEIDTVNTHYWCLEVDWVTLTSSGSGGVGLEFTGFDDDGFDDDGDGLFDLLRAVVTVNVPVGSGLAGAYSLDAVLRSSSRATDIVRATVEQDLVEGDNDVALDFDGETINTAGIDGPYVVTNVIVYASGDPSTYEWQSDGFTTTGSRPGSGSDHYLYSDFDGGFLVSPQVQSTVPSDGALGVALDTSVQITFNTGILSSTVNSDNIQVQSQARPASGVTGTWSYVDRVATFEPDSSLAPLTRYDVTIGTGLTATNGQTLATVFAFSFTTGEAEPEPLPCLLRVFVPEARQTGSISDESDAGFDILAQACAGLPSAASSPEPANESTDQSTDTVLRWGGTSTRSSVCDFDGLSVGSSVGSSCSGLTFGISGVTGTAVVLSAASATNGVTSSGSNVAGVIGGGQLIGGRFDAEQNYVGMTFGNDAGFTGVARLVVYRDVQATSVASSVDVTANGNDSCDQLIEVYTSVPALSWALEFIGTTTLSPCVDNVTFGTGSCPTRYDVYLSQANPPTTLVAQGLTVTECDVGLLSFGTRYYWKVVPWNCCGEASAPDVWWFETTADCPAPDEPSRPTPSDLATAVSVYTGLSWAGGSSVADCPTTTWDVYLDTSADPTTLIASDLATVACDPGQLADGTTYYWKVVAKSSAGTTTGPIWSFTTGQRSITLLYPNGGETFVQGTTETLTWTWTGPALSVTLLYSDSSGSDRTWYTIASGVGNTGSHDWLVPAPSSRNGTDPPYVVRIVDASDSAITDMSDFTFDILAQTCPLPSSVQYSAPGNGVDVSGTVTLQWSSTGSRQATVCDFDSLTAGQTLGSPCTGFTFGLDGMTGQARVLTAASAVSGVSPSSPNVVGVLGGGAVLGGYFGSSQSDVTANYIAMTFGNDSGYTGTVRLSAYMSRDGTGLAKRMTATANGNDSCDQLIELYSSIAVRSWTLEFTESVSVSPCIDDFTFGTEVCPTTFDVYFGTTNPPPWVAGDLTTTSYALGDLDELTTYYWQVIAGNCCDESTGSVWSFGTLGDPDFLTISGVSHDPTGTFPFPVVSAVVQVDTQAGNSCALDIDDFALTEDGVTQSPEWVNCRYGGGAADVVVVFDDTGGMGHDIWTLKEAVSAFADELTSRAVDSQFALVSFKDAAEIDLALTSSVDAFKSAIDALVAEGGGDYGEATLDAVMLALRQLSFRADAQPIIIVITGSPSHYDGDGSDVSQYTMMSGVRAVNAAGGTVFTVSPDYLSRSESVRLDDTQERAALVPVSDVAGDARILADGTGGLWQELSSADFSLFTTAIEASVSATSYTLVYQATNSTEDGTARSVTVTATDPARGPDDGTSTYTAPSASRVVPWQCTLAVAGIRSTTLEIGMADGAADALVGGEDAELPADVSDGAVAYLWCGETRCTRDVRGLAEEAEWLLAVAAGDEDAVVSWTFSDPLTEGKYVGLYQVDDSGEALGGTALWLAQTEAFIVPAGTTRTYVIRFASDLVFDLALCAGWNLASLPVSPSDASVASVFGGAAAVTTEDASAGGAPSTVGLVWRYESGQYISVSEVRALEGYWVYSMASAVVAVKGIPIASRALSLEAGWNLVGVPVHSAWPCGVESRGVCYFWDAAIGRYCTAEELLPGVGYWLRAARGCVLELSP